MIAGAYRLEVKYLKEFMQVMDMMESELQYRLSPLPELCAMAGNICTGGLRRFFLAISSELCKQVVLNPEMCIHSILESVKLTPRAAEMAALFGRSLGRYDAEGQLKGIRFVRSETKRTLDALLQNQDVRLRSYQTLGVCAGAAIVILFI